MGFFSFLGANQYIKEVEDQERYEEAFDLKQAQLGLSKANLELQEETLALKKLNQEQSLVLNMLPYLNSSGVGLSLGTKKSGTKTTGGSDKGNKFYAKQIGQNYRYIVDNTVASILANTNNAPGSMKVFKEFLDETHDKYSKAGRLIDGKLPEEDLAYIVNNLLMETRFPYKDAAEKIETQLGIKLSENMRTRMDLLSGIQVTNIGFPNVLDPTPQLGTEQIKFLKEEAFSVAQNQYLLPEIANINKTITGIEFDPVTKQKRDLRSLTEDENAMLGWLRLRGAKLDQIKDGSTKANPTLLFNEYGTTEAYNWMRKNSPLRSTFFFPEVAPSQALNTKRAVVAVPNKAYMNFLRDQGILQVGQVVRFTNPNTENGVIKTIGTVPSPEYGLR
tara:strand:+ start:1404 stop:2573 length:1170 start_codon:yes stop_codon:yes gene_type:complete